MQQQAPLCRDKHSGDRTCSERGRLTETVLVLQTWEACASCQPLPLSWTPHGSHGDLGRQVARPSSQPGGVEYYLYTLRMRGSI